MRHDKAEATQLRRSGKSYQEILRILAVPRSTLSGWFGKEDWSAKIRQQLTADTRDTHNLRLVDLNKIRGENLELAYDEARRVAAEEFELLKYNPIFIAGIMLYWGEGDKATRGQVRLTNTDPEMLKLYYIFLKDVCRISTKRIGAHVLLYPDLNEKATLEYWSSRIGIPLERFIKCTTIQGRHPTKRLGYGVCMVYVSSSYFKAKVNEWLALLPQELISRRYYENIKPEAGIV